MNKLRRSLNLGLLAGLPGISFVNGLLFPLTHAKGVANAVDTVEKERLLDSGFAALIDTFVPADETPGAIELGIHQTLLVRIRANQDYLRVILQMLDSMDTLMLERYGRHFEKATLAQRSEIVSRILSSREQYQDAQIQISSLRTSTLSAFYSTEAAFDMLEYHPPSQGGYPDYDRPPL